MATKFFMALPKSGKNVEVFCSPVLDGCDEVLVFRIVDYMHRVIAVAALRINAPAVSVRRAAGSD